jgi:hypothetical protein
MKYGQLLGTLVIGIALGALGMLATYHPIQAPTQTASQTNSDASVPVIDRLRSGSAEPVAKDTARYKNDYYGFAVSYPMELTQKEFPEGGDGMTVAFQKPNEEKGFQIFIIPYAEKQISQERIRADLAGAPMKNLKNIVLPGNIQAVHFESVAPLIGDSIEVWFIHNGYLFEVTTYRALDSWLAGILGTLVFTK